MVKKLFTVFSELQERYTRLGMNIHGGYSSFISGGHSMSLCNYVEKDGILLSSSGGIANDEAIILHCLCEAIEPTRILIIGNSYGFSTVFLSLTNPDSKLVAFDKYRTEGIKVTKSLLGGLKNKHVIQASTPEDIPAIVENYLDGSVDLVLIDAVHTNEMQSAEFALLNDFVSKDGCIVMHDVLSCNLLESYRQLEENFRNFTFKLILKSSTGIGIAAKENSFKKLGSFFDYFSGDEDEALKFLLKMFKEKNPSSEQLFQKNELEMKFPPHPQL